jgi:hypothetical protein
VAEQQEGSTSCPHSDVSSVASSHPTTSQKKKRKASDPLMNDETVSMLKEVSESAKLKYDKLVRHNKNVKILENKKYELEKKKLDSLQWKGKQEELDYRLKLVKEYLSLSAGGMSDDQIIRLFPKMKDVVKAMKGD